MEYERRMERQKKEKEEREKLEEMNFQMLLRRKDLRDKKIVADTNMFLDERSFFVLHKLAEYNFRMLEGASDRIQLEALLAQFSLINA